MKISVCVGTIRRDTVGFLIGAIQRQTHTDWELILAAQGGDESLSAEIGRRAEADARIHVIHLQEFGRSRALNRAMGEASADIFAFTDDDCEPAVDWLSTLAHCFSERPDVGIVAGNLVPSQARPFRLSTCPAVYAMECIYEPSASGFMGPPGFYWAGGNVAVRRSVVEKIGPFDEHLGPGTGFPAAEDTDFGLRAESMNVTMWTTPKSVVRHTYGRRYGLRAALKHHRGYALGSGALGGKLALWDHPLSRVWGEPKSLRDQVTYLLKRPHKWMLDCYKAKYIRAATARYMEEFVLGNDRLSQPRSVNAEGLSAKPFPADQQMGIGEEINTA